MRLVLLVATLAGLLAASGSASAIDWDWTNRQSPPNPGPRIMDAPVCLPPVSGSYESLSTEGVVCLQIGGDDLVHVEICLRTPG